MRVQLRYSVHITAMFLSDGGKARTVLTGAVLPRVQVRFICNNWHLCGLFWEDYKHKNLHVPTSPEVAVTLTEMLKTAQGESH